MLHSYCTTEIHRVVLKAGMPEFLKLKAGILKPGITKIKHRTNKGLFTRTTEAGAES